MFFLCLPKYYSQCSQPLQIPPLFDYNPIAQQTALCCVIVYAVVGAARLLIGQSDCSSNQQPINDGSDLGGCFLVHWCLHLVRENLMITNMSAPIVRATVKAVSRRKILSTRAALTLVSVSSLHCRYVKNNGLHGLNREKNCVITINISVLA